ncbi:protein MICRORCHIDIA 4 [Capsella rubella]|uniref:protein MICRORCHIDIA 4 n=1 Tax=Capsella rubella TaxID=81985 RepID=UPI000CD54569|nr:protein MICRORCHIDIA 4 [Capsella rubella]
MIRFKLGFVIKFENRSESEKIRTDPIRKPVGFKSDSIYPNPKIRTPRATSSSASECCRQFSKAGDWEGMSGGNWEVSAGGFDRVRVHPKYLHTNATCHTWSLGAFAELLDNAYDEVRTGATFVNVDVLQNRKDGRKMILIEDDGGGMNAEMMRHCMSLGYSAKSKIEGTIGKYGNGFKSSTMRLGADVIVFSRCLGKDGKSLTKSIGLLSYTFLRSTGREEIVVPMLEYERSGFEWCPMRSSASDWEKNVETMVQWSPFATEEDLLRQLNLVKNHGTRIIIYNLWEDDQGMLELDFDTDPHDIQLRGVNRDEKNIDMASKNPNSRHFLTYKYSLRSYASILYKKVTGGFRIILRGKYIEYHDIVNDMMLTKKDTYHPQNRDGECANNSSLSAEVTIGFVKDAKHHLDVQGFNVYHQHRLIMPFWRVWNAAGSDGRGVIGVLNANFIEPSHDKQGFVTGKVLSRLQAKLLKMQKDYWRANCGKIGYAPRQGKNSAKDTNDRESSPEHDPKLENSSSESNKRATPPGACDVEVINSDNDYDCDSLPEINLNELPEVPVTDLTEAPVTDLTEAPVTDLTEVPVTDLTEAPVTDLTEAPVTDLTEAPVTDLTEVPVTDLTEAPVTELTEVPVTELTEIPVTELTELPEKSSELLKPQSSSLTLSQLEEENKTLKERLARKEELFILLQMDLQSEREFRKTLEAELTTLTNDFFPSLRADLEKVGKELNPTHNS